MIAIASDRFVRSIAHKDGPETLMIIRPEIWVRMTKSKRYGLHQIVGELEDTKRRTPVSFWGSQNVFRGLYTATGLYVYDVDMNVEGHDLRGMARAMQPYFFARSISQKAFVAVVKGTPTPMSERPSFSDIRLYQAMWEEIGKQGLGPIWDFVSKGQGHFDRARYLSYDPMCQFNPNQTAIEVNPDSLDVGVTKSEKLLFDTGQQRKLLRMGQCVRHIPFNLTRWFRSNASAVEKRTGDPWIGRAPGENRGWAIQCIAGAMFEIGACPDHIESNINENLESICKTDGYEDYQKIMGAVSTMVRNKEQDGYTIAPYLVDCPECQKKIAELKDGTEIEFWSPAGGAKKMTV